jgi:hypothetical protein
MAPKVAPAQLPETAGNPALGAAPSRNRRRCPHFPRNTSQAGTKWLGREQVHSMRPRLAAGGYRRAAIRAPRAETGRIRAFAGLSQAVEQFSTGPSGVALKPAAPRRTGSLEQPAESGLPGGPAYPPCIARCILRVFTVHKTRNTCAYPSDHAYFGPDVHPNPRQAQVKALAAMPGGTALGLGGVRNEPRSSRGKRLPRAATPKTGGAVFFV